MKINKKIYNNLIRFIFIIFLCNCSGFEAQKYTELQNEGINNTGSSDGNSQALGSDQNNNIDNSGTPNISQTQQGALPTLQKLNCQYYEPSNISNTLKQVLNIQFGDVAVLAENGSQAQDCGANGQGACYYIYENLVVLGNKGVGVKQDSTCTASKFRVSTEIYINSCVQSLSIESNRKKLFPDGLTNFDKIYQAFLGRLPSITESQILKSLSQKLAGETTKMSGICAAIGASMEANLVI